MSSLIEDIKFKIQDEVGFPYESIHMFYEDEELNDKQSIIEIDNLFRIYCKIYDK